jgi:hypothetical protein
MIGLAMRMMLGERKETAMGMRTRGRTKWVKRFYKKRK